MDRILSSEFGLDFGLSLSFDENCTELSVSTALSHISSKYLVPRRDFVFALFHGRILVSSYPGPTLGTNKRLFRDAYTKNVIVLLPIPWYGFDWNTTLSRRNNGGSIPYLQCSNEFPLSLPHSSPCSSNANSHDTHEADVLQEHRFESNRHVLEHMTRDVTTAYIYSQN